MAQMVKNLPAIQKTRLRSLGWEDPLEEEIPLQYSCRENSMDRRAWWATVRGVARVVHDLATKPLPQQLSKLWALNSKSF